MKAAKLGLILSLLGVCIAALAATAVAEEAQVRRNFSIEFDWYPKVMKMQF